jgi:hypothetical protein
MSQWGFGNRGDEKACVQAQVKEQQELPQFSPI